MRTLQAQGPCMLRFDPNAPKKATNLSLNSKVLEMARELGMNVSQTVDGLLAEEVKRRYWEKWRGTSTTDSAGRSAVGTGSEAGQRTVACAPRPSRRPTGSIAAGTASLSAPRS